MDSEELKKKLVKQAAEQETAALRAEVAKIKKNEQKRGMKRWSC